MNEEKSKTTQTHQLSELLALEKAGQFQTALERIEAMPSGELNESRARRLNLDLLKQRLHARLKSTSPKLKIPNPQTEAKKNSKVDIIRATWSAIITMWKRQDYLAEQLVAIRSQSIPPVEIIIILNEDHIPESKIREIGGSDVKIIRSDINSLYSRWAVAYIAKGDYVSIFDDDIVPGKQWIENAVRACSSYNALVGAAGRIYNNNGIHSYYNLVVPNKGETNSPNTVSCCETDVYCDWVCNSYLFKREWVGHALSRLRYKDSFKTFDDIQLATSLYLSCGIRCVTPMQPSFDKEFHGSLQPNYGNDSAAIWKTNSDQHFAGRKAYIEELIADGYVPVQKRDSLYRFHLIVPFGERNTLERCLLTIKGQNYHNFTCTLIDDCCDGKDALDLVIRIGLDKSSLRYIKTTKKAYPLQAREIATDMLGACPADVIVHLDGDDWLPYPDVLSRLNQIYRKGGVHVTYGNALCIRKFDTGDFNDYSQYDMSRRWNVAQKNSKAPVFPFRKIEQEETLDGWGDAPWCGFHLRTFKYSKWLSLNRKSFCNSDGDYLRVATDAAVMIPILNSCDYGAVVFVPELSYVYQNSGNTIHGKGEITTKQKSEALACVANSDPSPDYERIRNALTNRISSISSKGVTMLHDSFIEHANSEKTINQLAVGINSNIFRSGVVTIITPNYLADAIICLMSYQFNLKDDCDLFVFIATENESEIASCTKLLASSGVNAIFPATLQYLKKESQNLAEKYKMDTDEYRWAIKAVVLIELLNRSYSTALFIDPDTYTVSDITDVHKIIARNPVSVFPHFRDPDHEYLRGVLYKDGFFNGGMLAATTSGIPHLRRLYERCLNELKKDPARHRWDDQKYFDLFALEVGNLNVNLDPGIDYNPWNYEPVEGLVAPSQRSVLLKSGYFIRHWHVSTMLINNSIAMKEKKFSVYRPIIAIYLMSTMYAILLILALSKFKKIKLGVGSLGLEARFNSLTNTIIQVSSAIPALEIKSLLNEINHSSDNDCNQLLQACVCSIKKSICFDNHDLFANILLRFFPDSEVATSLAIDLRSFDIRHVADKILGSTDFGQVEIAERSGEINAGELVKQRLRNLQLCEINY